MYIIAEWRERYDCNVKGHVPREGDDLRVGPLQFIRLKVHGHSNGIGFRKLKIIAGTRAMEVFGIFCKLLEIAGNQNQNLRGRLLNEKGDPATAEDLAFILDIPTEQVVFALAVLSDPNLQWLCDNQNKKESTKERITNTTQLNSTQASRKFRENPEFPGQLSETALLPTKTKKNTEDPRFDEFWAAYPKKADKIDSKRIWNKIKPDKTLFETILKAVELQKKSAQWQKNNGEFIPLPSTWLNGQRWTDELPRNKTDEAIETLKKRYAAEEAAQKAKVEE